MKNIGDYENINSVNRLYFISGEVDRYIEESNGNKYLIFASTDKNKEMLTKYTELWDGIKNLIKQINDKPDECVTDFIKIKFNSDDNLPLNKILTLHNLTVVVRSVFKKTASIIQIFFRKMFSWVIKILQYEGNKVSEGTDINKPNKSK